MPIGTVFVNPVTYIAIATIAAIHGYILCSQNEQSEWQKAIILKYPWRPRVSDCDHNFSKSSDNQQRSYRAYATL